MPSLPRRLLRFDRLGERLVPAWITDLDRPWLRDLLDETLALVGEPWTVLTERLAGRPEPVRQGRRRRMVLHLLRQLHVDRSRLRWDMTEVRLRAFRLAATGVEREVVLARVAEEFGMPPETGGGSLLEDLAGEGRVVGLDPPLDPSTLALHTNSALAAGLLACSSGARIAVHGRALTIVRRARSRGLLCGVSSTAGDEDAVLSVTGPLGLRRGARRYARALGALLPDLPWCRRYRLEARVQLDGVESLLVLGTGDPILPGPEPRPFDSLLERRFAFDFLRLSSDWELTREPEPLQAGHRLLFPDFGLRHRRTGRRWLLEIVGFWTPDYLEAKAQAYRLTTGDNLLLCVDRSLDCAEGTFARGHVLWFAGRRIPAGEVLGAIE